MHGKLILIVGSSGSGKGSLIGHIREHHPEFVYPPSYTTRSPRPGEVDGDAYRFVSDREFDERIADGSILEWAWFGGNRYGTSRSEILLPLEQGKVVLREIEIQGVHSLFSLLPREQVFTIFVDAGPWEELEERVRNRATITEESLTLRKGRYEEERSFIDEADYVVRNERGKLEEAKAAVDGIINEILSK